VALEFVPEEEPGGEAHGAPPFAPEAPEAAALPEEAGALEFVPEEEPGAGEPAGPGAAPEPLEAMPAPDATAPPDEAAGPGAPAASLPAEGALPDLAEELEEVAFYEGQGLLEEALDAVRDLAEAHPGHPLLAERQADLEAQLRARPAAAAPAAAPPPEPAPEAAAEPPPPEPAPEAAAEPSPPPAPEAPFDIGRELAAELGTRGAPAPSPDDFQYSVEDVFDQFKRGVEQAVRPEDSDTHYDLGIAYKEMGLLDDAIGEFHTALAGHQPRREADILTMIGLCQALKGEHREAVQAYRRALHSEYLTGEAAKALHYELGSAHEALGEGAVALWYFQKIAKVDPRYRDVRARVERLGGGPGQPPAHAAPRPPADGAARPPPAAPAPSAAPDAAPDAPPAPGGGPPPEGGPGPKKNIGYV
jgi:tetratricopeptide (TPR) repeat protein